MYIKWCNTENITNSGDWRCIQSKALSARECGAATNSNRCGEENASSSEQLAYRYDYRMADEN